MENTFESENTWLEDIQVEGLNQSFNAPLGEPVRAKTSLKMRYEAQTAVIERQLGGLEGVRARLGLSQRKMAQLLMVDPSAWTRWNRPESKAPPIIWRALQWYMILQEKIPGLTANYFLGSSPEVLKAEAMKEIRRESEAREALALKLIEFDKKIQGFKNENEKLKTQISDLDKKLKIWRVVTVIMTVTLINYLWQK